MSTITDTSIPAPTHGGHDLNFVRLGQGEPLVLIHGIGSQWQMWQPVLDLLARERDVIAIDLPGFGASAQLSGEPSIAALADAVSSLMGALGLERPHVAGNSLGGGLALELARTDRARSATALSPIGFATGFERPVGIVVLKSSHRLARRLGRLLDPLLRTATGRTLLQNQFFGRPWRVPADEAIGATHNLADSPGFDATFPHVLAFDWTHGDLDVPVTIAWGTRDRVLLPRQGERARRRMPRARHIRLKGCGHVPTWDDPEMVANVVLDGSRRRPLPART